MQATCKPHILHALHEVPISHTPRRRCNIPRGSHGGESTAFHHWGGSHFFLENMRTSRLDDVYSEIESTVEIRDPLALKSVFLTFRFASNEKFFQRKRQKKNTYNVERETAYFRERVNVVLRDSQREREREGGTERDL